MVSFYHTFKTGKNAPLHAQVKFPKLHSLVFYKEFDFTRIQLRVASSHFYESMNILLVYQFIIIYIRKMIVEGIQ